MILLLLSFADRSVAQAPPEPWNLEADRITYYSDPQKITAEGKVFLHHREPAPAKATEIRADTMTYQAKNSEISAEGNITLKDERGTTSASAIMLNLGNKTGRINAGTIYPADYEINFKGEFIERIDENRYIFHDGVITSCQTEGDKSPDWSFNCSKADITVDGMAYLKHATFRIKEIPVLYLPYLILPVKTTRQTGFLFPEISSSSRDGYGIVTPFFINLSPSSDLTIYPGYYEKRGIFSGMEFRHVNDYNSQAAISINYQQDRTEDPGPAGSENSDEDYRRDGYLRTEDDRYWIRGKADHHFSESSALRLDLDAVSDQDYLHEYREGLTGFTTSNNNFLKFFNRGLQDASLNFRESILQYSRRGPLNSGGIELRYVDDDLADLNDTGTIQTLPRARFSGWTPVMNLPMSFAWDSEYVYYQPDDNLGYQRIDLSPRLTMPTPFGSRFEGTIVGGFRETIYNIETDGDPENSWESANSMDRGAWNFSTNVATILARDFAIDEGLELSHAFRPNLLYTYLDSSDQDELPELDEADRLTESNNFTIELNNYFQSSKSSGATIDNRQVGYLKFSQSYDLTEADRDLTDPDDSRQPFSDLTMDLEISPLTELYLRYQTTLNLYGEGINSYYLQTRYSNNRLEDLTIDYYYLKGEDRYINLTSQLKVTDKVTASYGITRSLLEDHTTQESFGLSYYAQCWNVNLSNTRESDDSRLIMTFTLTGIGTSLETKIPSLARENDS